MHQVVVVPAQLLFPHAGLKQHEEAPRRGRVTHGLVRNTLHQRGGKLVLVAGAKLHVLQRAVHVLLYQAQLLELRVHVDNGF